MIPLRTTLTVGGSLLAMLGVVTACQATIEPQPGPAVKTVQSASPAVPSAIPAQPVETAAKVAARDVKLTSCKLGDFGTVTITLTLTNHGPTSSRYSITGEILDKTGARVGEFGTLTANPLAVGKVAKLSAPSFAEDPTGPVTCRVTGADRY